MPRQTSRCHVWMGASSHVERMGFAVALTTLGRGFSLHGPRTASIRCWTCKLQSRSLLLLSNRTHTLQIACNNTFRRQQHEKTPAKRRKRIVKCEKWSCSRRIDHFFAPKQRQGTRPKRDCSQRQAGTPVLQSRLSSTTCTAPPQHTSPLVAPPPHSRPSPRPRLASVRLPPHILAHLTAAGTRCCSAEQSRPGSSHPSRDDSITSAFRQPTSRTHPSPDCMFMRHLQHNHA